MTVEPLQLTSTCLADTLAIGKTIGQHARTGDVIALEGELGAGKTQLVRGLAAGLGLDPRHVSSPTFIFVQEYEPPDCPEVQEDETTRPVLVHIDAYRLTGSEQLDSIGWSDDLLIGAVLAVEWAPRIANALPTDQLHLQLEHVGDDQRRITVEPQGTWADRFPELLADLRAIVNQP